MDYTNIRKLETVHSTENANDYINLGWKVVNIFNTAYDTSPLDAITSPRIMC